MLAATTSEIYPISIHEYHVRAVPFILQLENLTIQNEYTAMCSNVMSE
jgi:hypothetical protein